MNKAVDHGDTAPHDAHPAGRRKLDWRKRMSDNIAYALLVYTALQIVVTVHALKTGSGSLLPYFALIILVAAIIPLCRTFEGRWMGISDDAAADPAYSRAYRRDQALLWLCAIGLPFVLTGIFKALASVL
jgi:hypothetical protein